MINIAICDDEIGTCSEIDDMICVYAKTHALQIETEVFYAGETLYSSMQEENKYDLILLDIQLLQLDGVQVGRQIREQLGNEKINIVYISAKETYAMSLFRIRPLDFLIKPITERMISDILDKFIRLSEINRNEFVFNVGKSVCKLCLNQVMFFECNRKKIEIHTISDWKEFYGTMQDVWNQVEGKGFWTIHKSYIVNSSFVAIYHYDSVELVNGITLPISQKYRKTMRDNLTELYRKR